MEEATKSSGSLKKPGVSEVFGAIFLVLGILVFFSVFSFYRNSTNPELQGQGNLIGAFGHYTATLILYLFGNAGFFLGPYLFLMGGLGIYRGAMEDPLPRVLSLAMILLSLSVLLFLLAGDQEQLYWKGGIVGRNAGVMLEYLFGWFGSIILALGGLFTALFFSLRLPLPSLVHKFTGAVRKTAIALVLLSFAWSVLRLLRAAYDRTKGKSGRDAPGATGGVGGEREPVVPMESTKSESGESPAGAETSAKQQSRGVDSIHLPEGEERSRSSTFVHSESEEIQVMKHPFWNRETAERKPWFEKRTLPGLETESGPFSGTAPREEALAADLPDSDADARFGSDLPFATGAGRGAETEFALHPAVENVRKLQSMLDDFSRRYPAGEEQNGIGSESGTEGDSSCSFEFAGVYRRDASKENHPKGAPLFNGYFNSDESRFHFKQLSDRQGTISQSFAFSRGASAVAPTNRSGFSGNSRSMRDPEGSLLGDIDTTILAPRERKGSFRNHSPYGMRESSVIRSRDRLTSKNGGEARSGEGERESDFRDEWPLPGQGKAADAPAPGAGELPESETAPYSSMAFEFGEMEEDIPGGEVFSGEEDPNLAVAFAEPEDLDPEEAEEMDLSGDGVASVPDHYEPESQVPAIVLKSRRYRLPMEILTLPQRHHEEEFSREMELTQERLERVMHDYGIQAKVTRTQRGPIITLYEIKPEPGVRVNRILGIYDEIKMNLEAASLRIIAPIPGKSTIGIEIPNTNRDAVLLGEIARMDGSFFSKSRDLSIILGKDIAGTNVYVDLAKLPHLLIAGATGAGKSVYMNSIIASLLYAYSPEDVRFIMVDPKMVELKLYEGIPHLLMPVITDVKMASRALTWAIQEMERRYQILSRARCRDIRSYNERIQEGRLPLERYSSETGPEKARKMPYIIILIDELSDLMMVSAKDVEDSIIRLTQKARAVGIHVIMATQRPSVDVITALIKANCPARISFQVAQKTDSRTILDCNGAETLLGRGDMLYKSPTSTVPVRIQAPLVTEPEIEKIVQESRKYGDPVYVNLPGDPEEGGLQGESGEFDEELFENAWRIVQETGKTSTSYIQRRLRIGYNRAANLIEIMEERGYLGPAIGNKPREILKRS